MKKLSDLFGACFLLCALGGVTNAQWIYQPGRDCTPSRAVWLGGYYSYPYAYYPYGYGWSFGGPHYRGYWRGRGYYGGYYRRHWGRGHWNH